MTIHNEHPFLTPESDRSPARRLRGRLGSPVTLWTAADGTERAGLTVSSVLVADGEPGLIFGILDPLSDLWDVLSRSTTGVVNLLGWSHRQLSDIFGYVAPAPGGPFEAAQWSETEWGPALVGANAWAGCRLVDRPAIPLGWGLGVQLVIEHAEFSADAEPLVHRRGRYYTF